MKGTHLGELEELILVTTAGLGEEAYGVSILNEVERVARRSGNLSAIHSVLRRLEAKGLLKSKMGGATAERGGRRKRYFLLTAAGKRTLDAIISQRVELYNRVPGYSITRS